MKRLVFCFDGTWNKLDSATPTNVVLTAETVLPLATTGAQVIYYDEGVGTGNKLDELKGGVLGDGLVQNLADAYRFIIFNYTPGDEIYVFGFSRGAYTARSFAGLLSTSGILDRRKAARATESIELYRARADTAEFVTKMMAFRRDNCSDTWVSEAERDWRKANAQQCVIEDNARVRVTYLGVWDTVGALGVPKDLIMSGILNKKHQFHDVRLSNFVRSARHAVAIDEQREEFEPTLWENIGELNQQADSASGSTNAPYQQMWFPGVHSSVGGGADQRGLSDRALVWVWRGAMNMGLQFDTSPQSRIFELAPKFGDRLVHSDDPSFSYKIMARRGRYRKPGPTHLHEVSHSAQRRWHETPERLAEGTSYRPETLDGVKDELNKLDPMTLGVGDKFREQLAKDSYKEYEIQPGDNLRKLAKRFYANVAEADRIFDVNRDIIEDPDLIFVHQKIRLPLSGLIEKA